MSSSPHYLKVHSTDFIYKGQLILNVEYHSACEISCLMSSVAVEDLSESQFGL